VAPLTQPGNEARKGEKEMGNGTAITSLFFIYYSLQSSAYDMREISPLAKKLEIWERQNFFLHSVVLTPLFSTSTSASLLFTRLLFHTSFLDLVSLISSSPLANK
jgi:hypothetical protein